jgi:hypothetical protein
MKTAAPAPPDDDPPKWDFVEPMSGEAIQHAICDPSRWPPEIVVIPVHAKVCVADLLPAIVMRIEIGPGGVRYQVGFWDAKDWKEGWFDSALVTSAAPKQRIGFAP